MGSSTALFSKNRVLEESLNPDETTCIHAQLYAINVIIFLSNDCFKK
jgi:hypothetical protein